MPEQDFQERTERATPRRRREARKEGQVAKSMELNAAAIICLGFASFYVLGPPLVRQVYSLMQYVMANAPFIATADESFLNLFTQVGQNFLMIMLPVFAVMVIIAAGINLVQVGVGVSSKALGPKFDKINPLRGLKRLFSVRSLVHAVRDSIKLAVVGFVAYKVIDSEFDGFFLYPDMTVSQLATELGIIVPPVRIRDNVQLGPNQYSLKVKGIKTASYELMPDHLLAINPGYVEDKLDGFETVDPAFGLKATWIIPGLKETAELKGFTTVEPSAVIATHLTEVVRSSAPEILSRQDVQHLTQTLKEDYPALVDGVIPEVVPLGTLQKILQSLLSERIPVRDLATIIETTSDYIGATKEPEVLAEYVRISLRRQITDLYKDKSGKIHVFTVDPAIEQQMAESIQSSKQGLVLGLEPSLSEKLLAGIGKLIEKMSDSGQIQLCICSPNIRLVLKKLAESKYPALNVVSYNEILPETELISIGIVRIENES